MKKEYCTKYNEHQYEDVIQGEFFNDPIPVMAKYIVQEEPTYKDNILIEALPSIMNMEQVIRRMDRRPIYSPQEREKEEIYRLHAIYRLDDCLILISKHLEIEQKLSIIIRRGYVNKSVFSPRHIEKLRQLSEILNRTEGQIKQYKEWSIITRNNAPASSGFSIFGISGGGKSTAVDNILSLYPQHIVHTSDGERDFLFHQLSWLKLDCTYNGNIKGICQQFFANVDKVLKTDYLRKYGSQRYSIDRMIIAMAHVAVKHALGVLVIDEIQHLKGQDGGRESSLNFFVTLMNEIKLPIVYIGTYKAVKNLLAEDFRHARRATGIGTIEMSYLKDGEELELFLEDMWEYQWVKNKCELTKEIRDAMYANTMGIIDIMMKLFMATQFEAIVSQKEIITPELITKVAKEKFLLVNEMIDALRNKDIKRLKDYDDIQCPNMKDLFEHSKQEIFNKKAAQEVLQNEKRKNKLKEDQLVNELCIFLQEMGYDYNKYMKVVKEIVEKFGRDKDIAILKKQVAKEIILSQGNSSEKKSNNRRSDNETIEEFTANNIKDLNQGIKD
ncbi:ATP-binding protein [Clostridium saccharoperbutylacetonicum]|uniref:ATP-binding protein n=1 Tax=Clostridium saccharoperbutylacetonicum TaxID=36745 RepID=UPI0039ECF20E